LVFFAFGLSPMLNSYLVTSFLCGAIWVKCQLRAT
jgi:hypothetical protein